MKRDFKRTLNTLMWVKVVARDSRRRRHQRGSVTWMSNCRYTK